MVADVVMIRYSAMANALIHFPVPRDVGATSSVCRPNRFIFLPSICCLHVLPRLPGTREGVRFRAVARLNYVLYCGLSTCPNVNFSL